MRKFIVSVASLMFMASTVGLRAQSTSETSSRPNIIVILADDLGFGDVGFTGSNTINTPNIDSLANNGRVFTNGYASSATSTPSRYALMTGMYPWRNKDAKILPGDAPLLIDTAQFTLPKMMQSAGYHTGAIGKWHLGMGSGKPNWNDTIRPGAHEIGFDYSCIIAATNDRVPTVYVENGLVVGLDPNDPIEVSYQNNFKGQPTAIDHPEMLKMKWSHDHNHSIVNGISRIGYMKGGEKARWVDEEMADYFLDKVKSFIDNNKSEPFFLYYGLHQPHVPRVPHPRFAGKSGLGPRGDVIVEADWCVGQLVNHLDSLGMLENTIIVFSSDNGPVLDDGYQDNAREMLGQHSPTLHRRGGKYSLFDGGCHVPLAISWKGHIKPSSTDALVCQMDLTASLANLVGAQYPDSIDSQNILPALLGQSDKGRDELVIEAQGKLGLRKNNWVLMPPYKGAKTNMTGNELGNLDEYGLFDLKADPYQLNNLASKYPDILNELKVEFERLTSDHQ